MTGLTHLMRDCLRTIDDLTDDGVALSVSLVLTGCSAVTRPTYADPPRLMLPALAEQPCQFPTLPADPTQADLETAYIARGGQIVTCDAARNLAVETLKAERSMIDQWLKQRPR